jgi:hypothetical protein
MSCISDFSQPFPQTGRLAKNLNLSLDGLCQKIGGTPAIVYSYIVKTVKNHEDHFIQKGSAPNFQGDLITLCTCKHRMRTSLHDMLEWKDKWIAGFTGVEAGNGSNALVYLMKVSYTFESYYVLWNSKEISMETKKAKAAHLHKCGDIYEPKDAPVDPFDCQSYEPPCEKHSHYKDYKWHNDIDYEKGYKGRKPVLLAGDTDYSFLWIKPKIVYNDRLPRNPKKLELKVMIENLKIV